MYKKPTVSWVHHIYWHVPPLRCPSCPRLCNCWVHWAHPTPQVLNVPLRNLAIFHWERWQNIFLCLWKQITLHQKGIPQEEWSDAPKSCTGTACPLLQVKTRTQDQFPLPATDEKLEDFTAAAWFSEQQGYAGPQYLTYPLILIKGNWVSADIIWLLEAECLQEACYNKYLMLDWKKQILKQKHFFLALPFFHITRQHHGQSV